MINDSSADPSSRYPGEVPTLLKKAAELAGNHGTGMPALADALRISLRQVRNLLGEADRRPTLHLVRRQVTAGSCNETYIGIAGDGRHAHLSSADDTTPGVTGLLKCTEAHTIATTRLLNGDAPSGVPTAFWQRSLPHIFRLIEKLPGRRGTPSRPTPRTRAEFMKTLISWAQNGSTGAFTTARNCTQPR